MRNNGKNINIATNRQEFRAWLQDNHETATECWLDVTKGKPQNSKHFWYIDAVEEALCFGWIDNVYGIIDSKHLQRFSPRAKNSPWTELNKERVRRLEHLGLMTDAGRRVLPPMGPRSFKHDPSIEAALKKARLWSKFKQFPALYQRIRLYNIAFYKNKDIHAYQAALNTLIKNTKEGKMYGQWNDYGRLIDYK